MNKNCCGHKHHKKPTRWVILDHRKDMIEIVRNIGEYHIETRWIDMNKFLDAETKKGES